MTRFQYQMYIGMAHMQFIIANNYQMLSTSKLKHGDKYDYSKVNYENTRKQVIVICKEHGEFKQTPNDHLSGYGCTKCAKIGYSKICIEWLNKLMIDKIESKSGKHILNAIKE